MSDVSGRVSDMGKQGMRGRITVRLADSGIAAVDAVVNETSTDRTAVIRELLMVSITTPRIRQDVVTRLKQRKGIE